ncbi:MAG: putative bifunctional diguanylate cyclase/phosphodiesterase [Janthinobacterium lividum]
MARRFGRLATPAPVVDKRHEREARIGMLRETFEIANYSTVTHLAVSMMLGYIFWGEAPGRYLVSLNVAMFIVVSFTTSLTFWFRTKLKGAVSDAAIRRGFLLAKAVALLIGLLWSTMPAMLVPRHESGYQLVAVATTVGLISDAYVVGPIFAVSTLLIMPIVLGFFIGLSRCAQPFGLYISLLLVIYTLFILFSTRHMSNLSYQRFLDRIMVQSQSQTIGLLLNEFEDSATDWLWETDAEGRLLHAPQRMTTAISEPAERLKGMSMSNLLARYASQEGDRNGVVEVLAAMARREAFHDHVVRLETTQGTRWWRLNGNPAWEAAGLSAGYRGVGSDITQSHEAETRISYLASHDTLTGLLNRASFQAAVEEACRTADPSRASTALLSLDLDGFKAVNDGHGHAAGDLLLQSVAARLTAVADGRSRVYRLGGDEFAILHEGHDPAGAETLATDVVARIGKPHPVGGMTLYIGVSIGIAYISPAVRDIQTLLSHADLALYSVKASGKGHWRTFNATLESHLLRRHRLDVAMREALAADELQLHYQPLVDIESERVVGVEALLRWHSPEEGWISPTEIIPIAEATGFILDIGRWALRRACTDALAWPGLTVAVNISSLHFRSETFCDDVDTVLAQTGLPPSRLEIEITESILLESGGEATVNMRRLRDRGVRLSLDDFGTGYSSLSYLAKFAFDKLKIDRSFVKELHVRRDTLAIFDAMIHMAAALGMAVTVEGVEHRQQIDILRQRFTGTIQGYYYSKPKPASLITEQIHASRVRQSTN